METIEDRFQQCLDKLGIKQADVARHIGASPTAISKIASGETRSSRLMPKIAEYFGVSESWLLFGIERSAPSNIIPIPNTKPITNKNAGAYVPVISWVAAGCFHNVETLPEDELIKWVPCPVPHSQHTFALKISGVSMENPNGKPSFEDGDIIYVDPEKNPENKSCVIITLEGSSAATFKQLIIESDGKYIRPLNPDWHEQIIKINGNAIINGVVIGKWVDVF